jgi:hypothetical protein
LHTISGKSVTLVVRRHSLLLGRCDFLAEPHSQCHELVTPAEYEEDVVRNGLVPWMGEIAEQEIPMYHPKFRNEPRFVGRTGR